MIRNFKNLNIVKINGVKLIKKENIHIILK